MDHVTLRNPHRLIPFVSKRKKGLSKGPISAQAYINEKKRKRILGFLFILLSFPLGFFANSLSEELAYQRFESEFRPSEKEWLNAFVSRNFSEIKSKALLQRIYRQLPTKWDEPGTVWKSKSLRWALYFSDSTPRLFYLGTIQEFQSKNGSVNRLNKDQKELLPKGWIRIGANYPHLRNWIEIIDQARLEPKKREILIKKAKNLKIWSDPRQVHY